MSEELKKEELKKEYNEEFKGEYKFKTIQFHGRPYVTTSERVKYFRTSPRFEGWSLETEWKHLNFDNLEYVCCRVIVRDKEDRLIATGTAFEKFKSTLVNTTSHVENCETSAVGRALAFLGIGIEDSICSWEELQSAVKAQEKEKKERLKLLIEMNKELRERVLSLPAEASEEKNRIWKEINDRAQGDPFISYDKVSQQFVLQMEDDEEGKAKKGGTK